MQVRKELSSPRLGPRAQSSGWRDNPAWRAVFWTYWIPLVIGGLGLSFLSYWLLFSGGLGALGALGIGLGLTFLLVVALDETQRQPRSLSIRENSLRIRHGLRPPWHETLIPFSEVENFSVSPAIGTLALVVHYRRSDFLHRLKHQSWFLQKDLIEEITEAHSKWAVENTPGAGQ